MGGPSPREGGSWGQWHHPGRVEAASPSACTGHRRLSRETQADTRGRGFMAAGAPHGLGVITKPQVGGNHSRKDEKRACHSPIPESTC